MRLLKKHLILIIICCASCTKTHNYDKEKQEILALHNSQKAHHFNKNVDDFVSQFSDNFYSVSKGNIIQPTVEESKTRFSNYFNAVEFIKWEDINEPIINFSSDFTMAYTIVKKLVVVSYVNAEGKKEEQATHFAWCAIYKKYNNVWKLDCMVSTNKN